MLIALGLTLTWSALAQAPAKPTEVAIDNPKVIELAVKDPKKKGFREPPADEWNREVVRSKIPVIVEYYASWCAPCKHLKVWINGKVGMDGKPDEPGLADELAGQVRFVSVMVDNTPNADRKETDEDRIARLSLDHRKNTRELVPEIQLYIDGEFQDFYAGAISPYVIKKWILDHLKSKSVGTPSDTAVKSASPVKRAP